jgi:hypothetical protein
MERKDGKERCPQTPPSERKDQFFTHPMTVTPPLLDRSDPSPSLR